MPDAGILWLIAVTGANVDLNMVAKNVFLNVSI